MVPVYLTHNGYLSCIKIAGTSILPPLLTDERRKELKVDKIKAIEIEKKLKRKRSSIDSGVMTGSYIDNFKSGESQHIENSSFPIFSDLISKENLHYDDKWFSSELDSGSTDNFLQSALEDLDFREFFYSTAEKIFKDNHLVHVNTGVANNYLSNCEDFSTVCKENENTEISTNFPTFSRLNNSLDASIYSNLTLVSSTVSSDHVQKCSENAVNDNVLCTQNGKQLLSPQRLVRRNSYTLESPSPVLLEHMAKKNAINKQENEQWKSLSDKGNEKLEFKTFSLPKKLRKTWCKKNTVNSPTSKLVSYSVRKVDRPRDKSVTVKRSKTFVKETSKNKQPHYSLPSSSRTSPIQMCLFARSADCIQSLVKNTLNVVETNINYDHDLILEPTIEVQPFQQTDSKSTAVCDNKNSVTNKGNVASIPEISANSLLNNIENISHSYFHSENLSPPIHASQGITTQPVFFQPKQICHRTIDSRNIYNKDDSTCEIDDSVSMCSSLSLSKFMPLDDNVSKPSTSEDLSLLFSELQIQHEQQIKELLEKQHKEKIMLSKLHSNSTTLSNRSSVNFSVCDLPYDNNFYQSSNPEEMKTFCSRVLFPPHAVNPKEETCYKNKADVSVNEKDAACKITAYVRGYLTRRLLKTEKVKQLIDIIKESLSCAFSLQSETRLQRKDLELHERLAHQLSSAFYELQEIMDAPAEKRMAIIAADREKLKKPLSRPSSAISLATQKSILRRQKSLNSAEKKVQENRTRAKSLSVNGSSGLCKSPTSVKNDSTCAGNANDERKPWK